MDKQQMRQCPGCKVNFAYQENLAPYQFAGIGRYGVAIPECLAAFFDLLAISRNRFDDPGIDRLMVDAYAVQHPRHADVQEKLAIELRLIKASIQSIGCHLIGLYCAVELKMDALAILRVMNAILSKMHKQGREFDELRAPHHVGSLTAQIMQQRFNVSTMTVQEHSAYAYEWASDAWLAWKDHHAQVRAWYKGIGR